MSYRAKIMRRKMGETFRQSEAKAENVSGKRAVRFIRDAREDIRRAFDILDSLPAAAAPSVAETVDGVEVLRVGLVDADLAAELLSEAASAKGAATRARNQAFTELTTMKKRGRLQRLVSEADKLGALYDDKRAAAIARLQAQAEEDAKK